MRNRVRELRLQRGWTLEQLAERAGLSLGQVSKIETGQRGWSVQSLQKIAKALGCKSVAELLDVTDAWQEVPVFGIVEAGGVVQPRANEKQRRVKAPMAHGELLALLVRNNSLYPRYTKGSAIFCAKDTAPPTTCIGQECLVQVENGQSLIRTISQGSAKGRYNLTIHNQLPELDCVLISCRPVVYTTPNPTIE